MRRAPWRSRVSPSRSGRGDCSASARPRPRIGRSSAGASSSPGSRTAGRLSRSGTGQTIVIRGEAGIGKTRLVEEFQAQAAAEGFACHLSLVLDFGAGTGQDAIRALVRSLLGLPASTAQAAAQAAPNERRARRSPIARVFLNDFSTCRSRPSCARCTTRWTARRAAAVCARRLQRWSAGQHAAPLLLAVEDVHWADRPPSITWRALPPRSPPARQS